MLRVASDAINAPMLRTMEGLVEDIPGSDRAESALHVGIYERQTKHVGSVDPTKSAKMSGSVILHAGLYDKNLPFRGHALEIAALVAVFSGNFVRVQSLRYVVLLNNNAVEVHERFGAHVDPAVGQPC